MSDTRKLLDRNEITELLTRLARWLDKQGGDPAEIYDEQVVVRSPRGEFRGRDEVVEFVLRSDAGEHAQHFHTDLLIDQDGDRAVVHAYQLVKFYQPGQPPHRTSGLRARHVVRRRPEGWRLAESAIELVWLDPQPVSA